MTSLTSTVQNLKIKTRMEMVINCLTGEAALENNTENVLV